MTNKSKEYPINHLKRRYKIIHDKTTYYIINIIPIKQQYLGHISNNQFILK